MLCQKNLYPEISSDGAFDDMCFRILRLRDTFRAEDENALAVAQKTKPPIQAIVEQIALLRAKYPRIRPKTSSPTRYEKILAGL